MKTGTRALEITKSLLKRLPLPPLEEGGDKEERGRVLFVGGSREMPGAVVLASLAALRAGAGKLRVVTAEGAAATVAAQLFEARVYPFKETKAGEVSAAGLGRLGECADGARAVCVGPGMGDERNAARCVKRLLAESEANATMILDANALADLRGARELVRKLEGRALLTPNADELGGLLEEGDDARSDDESAVDADVVVRKALSIAESYDAVAVAKGRETFIATPGGEVYVNRAGNVGLATSGSGDVLAGVIAGLAARGADAVTAALWGVHAHALAGDCLAKRVGRVGYLARELLDEIPRVLERLGAA